METTIFFYDFPSKLVSQIKTNKNWELIILDNDIRDQSFVEFDVKYKGDKVMTIGRSDGFGFGSQPAKVDVNTKFVQPLRNLVNDNMEICNNR